MPHVAFGPEVPLFFFFVFIQVSAAFLLLNHRGAHPRLGLAILATLFFLNAVVGFLLFLDAIDAIPQSMANARRALDDPTALLIFAYLAARWHGDLRQRVGAALFGAAILQGLYLFVFPHTTLLPYPIEWALLVLPSAGYWFSLAALTVVLARGKRWERWVALAFLARFLYFGARSWFGVATGDEFNQAYYWVVCLRPDADCTLLTPDAFSWFTLFFLTFVGLLAAFLLFRGPEALPSAIAGPILFSAPLLVALENLADSASPEFMHLLTIGFVRPVLVAVAYEPVRIPQLGLRSAAAAASSVLAYLGLALTGYGPHAAAVMGLLFPLFLFGVLEYIKPAFALPASFGAPNASAAPEPGVAVAIQETLPREAEIAPPQTVPVVPMGQSQDQPHWERILLALRGSSAADQQRGVTEWQWTQQGLAERTGTGVRRVSEFAGQMDRYVEQRLDEFLPGWRTQTRGAVPHLVEVHRAIARGVRGVRVAYRLTEWGERLAAALAARTPSGNRSETAKNPGRGAGAAPHGLDPTRPR